MWGWIAWIVVALAVWVAVAAFVGVLLGRAVRRRDRQVPDGDPVEVFPATPGQHCRDCAFVPICPAKSAGSVIAR